MAEAQSTDPMIAALLRERDSYRQQDKPDRVDQVDEQLRLRGYTDPDGDEQDKSERRPAGQAPKGRQAPPKRTA